MHKPFFSIIIPTYNRASFLPATIQSVIKQTYQNWECIVVDDGSTDNTEEIVASFQDSRIKNFYKVNEERSIARNYGIERAKGEYICFLDSDDIYFPDHLTYLYAGIKKNNFPEGIFHMELIINSNGTKAHERWFANLDNKEIIKFLLKGKALYINAICVTRLILMSYKFPPEFSYLEDQHLWIRILLKYPFFSIDKVTTQWNVGEDSSVLTNFSKQGTKNLIRHLSCITDLENTLMVKRSSIISKKDFQQLKIKKALIYIDKSLYNKRFFLAFKQYIASLRYIDFKIMTISFLKRLKAF